MKKITIISVIGIVFLLVIFSLKAATTCTATADNGSTCSQTCNEGVATCQGGAKTTLCYCKITTDGGGGTGQQQYVLTAFANGERAYFVDELRPFIENLGSQAATDLALALDQVIAAVDIMDDDAYNDAEYNYHDKRLALSYSEIDQLDQWVAENGFF